MQEHVDALGFRIASLVARLRALGYVFERPENAFPGPEACALDVIRKIESKVGRIPEALKLFWTRVGSVDLSGSHPDWGEPPYCPDQLVVFPASSALYDLEDDDGNPLEYVPPFRIIISPDDLTKDGISGAAPYSIDVPAVAEDPPLNNSSECETFLEHTERSLKAGGFPALVDCDHNWPLERLKC